MRMVNHNYVIPFRDQEHVDTCYAVLKSLTEEELSKLWNGVGSNELVFRFFKPPQWVRDIFSEASKFHDVAYWIGGSKHHRIAVDREFAIQCFKAIYDLPWLQRFAALLWVKIDDDILRNFGSLTFVRRLEPCYDIEQLLKEVESGT